MRRDFSGYGYPLTTFVPRKAFQRLPSLNVHLIRAPNLPSRMPESTISPESNPKERITHGSKSHIMTISSSLPLASQRPLCAHRTHKTGPVCIVNVLSDFGGLFDSSEAGFKIGFVLHIRILASSPPVAMREPSGCTCTEKMERRFGFSASLLPESTSMLDTVLSMPVQSRTLVHNPCRSRELHIGRSLPVWFKPLLRRDR